jgi:hypothetical protein
VHIVFILHNSGISGDIVHPYSDGRKESRQKTVNSCDKGGWSLEYMFTMNQLQ